MPRLLAALLVLLLLAPAFAEDEKPLLTKAKDDHDTAVRVATAQFEKAKKAADDRYAATIKAERAAAMRKGDLERANHLDRDLKALAPPAPTTGPATAPTFDLSKAITVVRYYSGTNSFDVTPTITKLATDRSVEIPMSLWQVTGNDPKPGGGPKYLELSFTLGDSLVSLRTELPDDISPSLTVAPKAK